MDIVTAIFDNGNEKIKYFGTFLLTISEKRQC